MKKILLTGFMPFGGEIVNPSWEIVSNINDNYNGNCIDKLELPVVWGQAQDILYKALDSKYYDYIIMIGQAGGENNIRIERVGLNICGAILDEEKKYHRDLQMETSIFNDGENAYFSSIECERILKAIKEDNIKVKMSYSAGVFLCNYVLYSALYKVNKEKLNTKVGFIHVPYLKEQNKDNYMNFEDMKKAIEMAIDNC